MTTTPLLLVPHPKGGHPSALTALALATVTAVAAIIT